MGKLLKEKEISDRLGLHVQTVRNWRFQGTGPPYVKIGAAIRYDEDVLNRYIEKNTINPRD